MWPDYNASSDDCRRNYSYFSSSDYLRNAYHFTALFTIPLSIFTFYCILKTTPSRMKNMKTPLLISHAWSTNLDLMFTVYFGPMIFFPSASVIPLGFLGTVGVGVKWQCYWGQVSVSMVGVCIVMLYENRYSQITTVKLKMKSHRTRLIYFGMNYVFAFVVTIPFYLEHSDQTEVRSIVLKRIPCPTIEFFDLKTYALLKGGEVTPFWSITLGMGSIIFQVLFYVFSTIYHLTVVPNKKVSDATKSLQKKFLGYVSMQVSIPFLALAFPITYSMIADKYDFYNQAYNNNAMLIMANHGLLSTCCTLFIYKPYREFVLDIFFRTREERRPSIAGNTQIHTIA